MQVPNWIARFVVIASLFLSIYAQVNWSTLTSTQLSGIDPASFGNISSDQLGSIPSSACEGFLPGQVAAITPSAFAGWRLGCVTFLPSTAWNQTTAAQIAQLTTNATAGLTASVVRNIPLAASAGWTSVGLLGISSTDYDGCAGFSWAQFAAIPLAAYTGWNPVCVYQLNYVLFANISAASFNAFPIAAYEGITNQQTAQLSDSVLLSITLSNFVYFTEDAISGLSPHQLAILVQKYGTNLTSILTNDQLRFYGSNVDRIVQFKAMIPNPLAPLYKTLPQNTTWLQLSLTSDILIDSKVIQSNGFSSRTVWGITKSQASLVTYDALQTFQLCCGKYILPDTINGLTCTQLSVVNSSTLGLEAWNAYNLRAEACPSNHTTSTTSSTSGSTTRSSTSSGNILGISLRELAILMTGIVLSFGVSLVFLYYLSYIF